MALPKSAKRKIFDQRYEILSIVGRGAESVVYHAKHISGTGQDVALKVLIQKNDSNGPKSGNSKALPERLRKEALTLVSCRTKHVVRLDDFHSVDDICYLSMEYAPNGDLLQYAEKLGGKVPAEQTTLFLRQCLEALEFIHATGVIHRDIKPENILVLSESEIRMADFGLALLPGDELSIDELKQGVGTFAYLPPETIHGTGYDTQSDLYALGLSFLEIAAGKNPFQELPVVDQLGARKDSELLNHAISSTSLPLNVQAVIRKLVAFDTAERFSSALEARKALDNATFEYNYPQASMDNSGDTSSLELKRESTNYSKDVSHKQKIAANSDTPEQPLSEPTARIDLDRIKSIIESNAPQKPAPQATKSSDQENQRAPRNAYPTAAKSITPQKRQSSSSRNKNAQSVRPMGIATFLTIAVGFALLTVVVLLSSNFIKAMFDDDLAGTPTKATEVSSASIASKPGPHRLHTLPRGVHSGLIKGIFPKENTPLAFLSSPSNQTLTLIVGAPGWIPTEIKTGKDHSIEYIFRTNGLILKFNQEMSSATITGTVTDVVTGKSGSWVINTP
jgi:serine/threonine protein kinase